VKSIGPTLEVGPIKQNSGFSTVEQKRRPGKLAYLACLFTQNFQIVDNILGF
jgi:hypothetical protein